MRAETVDKSSRRRTPRSALSLPKELDSAAVTIRISMPEASSRALFKKLGGFKASESRPDNNAVRGVVASGGLLKNGHAHFEVVRLPKGKEITLEIGLFQGSSSSDLDLAKLISLLAEEIRITPTDRAIVAGNFTFDLRKWDLTFTLPISPPATVEGMPGGPRICGLDFAFSKTDDVQPLHRAFVTTYDAVSLAVIRLLMIAPVVFGADLPASLLNLVSAQIPVFVRKKEGV